MTVVAEPLRDIPSAVETLRDYSELQSVSVRVYRPASEEGLRRIFEHARATGVRVTFRGGGHSFDSQSLGTGLVVSMASFDCIRVRPEERLVEVGAGASWGAVVARLESHGLVPAVTVTTEHASVGGTLSGDCLSRFSPSYGKEGTHVEHFELMTPDGQVLRCTPPRPDTPPAEHTLGERLFLGAIGGLGYLGAVLSITFRVLRVGPPAPISVRTTVRKHTTFDDLVAALIPTVREMGRGADPADESKHDAVYSGLYCGRRGAEQGLVMTSTFSQTARGRPMLLFRPGVFVRVPVECLIRWSWFNALLWWFAFRWCYRDGDVYVNDLAGYTFFMDGNARTKRIARRFGCSLKTLQQTFILPVDLDRGGDRAQADLTAWMRHVRDVFEARGLKPTLHDVLYLPRDLPFGLSATAETAGFAVSYAFETSREGRLLSARQALEALADDLWEMFDGRVYLVKDVCASQPTLAAMYGGDAVRFLELKREVDPEGVLRNEFFERIFGELAERLARGAAA